MHEPLASLNVIALCVGLAAAMLIFTEIGFRIGGRIRNQRDKDAPVSLSPMVGGLLGMLAFVLAFTFSMAAGQHDARKQNMLDESNAIGTAYLRASLLDDPPREEVRSLLREYVNVRLQGAAGDDLDHALEESVRIHEALWQAVSAAAVARPDTNTALVLESINEVIDMHQKRVTAGLRNRIPGTVWLALLLISALTMLTLGTQIGLSGKRRWAALIPLALAFAVLVALVVDLDRPQKGLITVSQQAMVELAASIGASDG